jgi:hypothetical protein
VLGADVSCVRGGVLACTACIVLGRTMSTAAWTSAMAVVVSSIVIADVALVTSTAAVFAPAIVASRVPTGVSSIARFCDSKRTFKIEQDGVTDMEMNDHRTAYGNH